MNKDEEEDSESEENDDEESSEEKPDIEILETKWRDKEEPVSIFLIYFDFYSLCKIWICMEYLKNNMDIVHSKPSLTIIV